LSVYGFDISPQKIMASGLNLKKVIRLTGRSTRLVPNNEPALNSAQVLHNKLTEPLGWELLFIKDGAKTILAQTTHEQDIDSYTLRDRGRPKRDARIGMLPPKLAQIIVNLAVSQVASKRDKLKILDPFCGTGVILQEAGLMGYGIYGTDLDERTVEYTRENLNWLTKMTVYEGFDSRFESADATSYHWPHEYDVVASETYLGRAFTTVPPSDMLEKNRQDCNVILTKFLKNIHEQIKPGTRLALAMPAWFAEKRIFRLPLLDCLGEIGYNRIDFKHATHTDLIYHRDGQIVGRELVVLTRK
jgi:tRNA G10  N-methylase Trm11